MTDISAIDLKDLSRIMEWRIIVNAASDSITFWNGQITGRGTGGIGLGPFENATDDAVLQGADSIDIATEDEERVTVDPSVLVDIEPFLRPARRAAHAILGGGPTQLVRLLPTFDGTLGNVSTAHPPHRGTMPKPLPGVALRYFRCPDCDLFYVGT